MSKITTDRGDEFASIRVYIFNCTYDSDSWQDDPQILLDILRDKLDRIVGFTYKTIKVCGLRKTLVKQTEVHVDGIEYFSSDRLNATEIDNLRLDLQNALNEISTFTYQNMDVVSDRFLDNPTIGYTNKSMSVVN